MGMDYFLGLDMGYCNIAILKARKHSVSGLFLCIL